MTDTLHRENRPPIDLDPVARRIKDRRMIVANWKPETREIVDADTDMMEALMLEVRRVRMANASLRELLGTKVPA